MQYVKEMIKTKDGVTCDGCKSTLVHTGTELVCRNSKCSFNAHVIAERFSDNSRDYDISENGEGGRTGRPQSQGYSMKHSTSIGTGSTQPKDGKKHNISGERKKDLRRQAKLDEQQTVKSLPQRKGDNQILRISNVLNIPEILRERGYEIFHQCLKQKMLTGRTSEIFSAACLYVACKEDGQNKTIKDFVSSGNFDKKTFTSYYNTVSQTLEIKSKIVSPTTHVSKIASKAEPPLNEIIQRKAIDIINQLDEKAGKDPVSIAAAALCYVAQLKNTKHTLRQIAIAAELSEVTVRNRIKDIKKQVIKK